MGMLCDKDSGDPDSKLCKDTGGDKAKLKEMCEKNDCKDIKTGEVGFKPLAECVSKGMSFAELSPASTAPESPSHGTLSRGLSTASEISSHGTVSAVVPASGQVGSSQSAGHAHAAKPAVEQLARRT